MFRPTFARVPPVEWLLLCFLLFSVLWRGGKSLEATWMLMGVAGALTVADGMRKREEVRPTSPRLRGPGNAESSPLRQGYEGQGMRNGGILWGIALGFLAWTTVSYFFSSTGNYGLDEVLRDGALILIFLWTMRNAGGDSGARFLHRFMHTITVAAVLGSFFGLLVYALQPVNRFVGTFFDYRFHTDYWPNAWAQFVLLAWPVIVLWMRGRSVQLHVAGCMMLGGVLGTLLLSYSRGAMIAFGGQLLLLVVWAWVQRKRSSGQEWKMENGTWKMMTLKIVLVCIVSFSLFFIANAVRGEFHTVQSVGEKITFTADEGGSSLDERKQFWRQSLQLISERPLFGWGPYSFRFVHQHMQTGVLQTSDHPHNVFLKLAVERGIVAAILFAMLVAVILWPMVALLYCCIVRKRITNTVDADQQYNHTTIQQCFLCIAMLGVLAHNLIDYNLQFVGIALPFWVMMGMLAGHAKCGVRHAALPTKLNKKIVHQLDLIIAIILLTVALREGVFLVVSSTGRHAEKRGEFAMALTWYDRSAAEWFSRDMHLSRVLLAMTQREMERAQDAMDVFLHLNARDPRGWRLQGDLLRMKGDIEGAVHAYAKAYELGKWNDVSISLALAEVLSESERHAAFGPLRQGYEGQGMRNAESLLKSMKPELDALLGSFVEAIVHNAHFVALSHNAEDAIALSTFLAREFPDSAPRYEVLAARADFAMRSERAKVKSRPASYLW